MGAPSHHHRVPLLVLLAVQARSLLKQAEGRKKLTKAEAKELESDLRHDINTQFGTRNENFALSVYERRSGTEVRCRPVEQQCRGLRCLSVCVGAVELSAVLL